MHISWWTIHLEGQDKEYWRKPSDCCTISYVLRKSRLLFPRKGTRDCQSRRSVGFNMYGNVCWRQAASSCFEAWCIDPSSIFCDAEPNSGNSMRFLTLS